jgi:hypothetical protein
MGVEVWAGGAAAPGTAGSGLEWMRAPWRAGERERQPRTEGARERAAGELRCVSLLSCAALAPPAWSDSLFHLPPFPLLRVVRVRGNGMAGLRCYVHQKGSLTRATFLISDFSDQGCSEPESFFFEKLRVCEF